MGISDLNVALSKFRKAQAIGNRQLANYYFQKAEVIRASITAPKVHCKCKPCRLSRWR